MPLSVPSLAACRAGCSITLVVGCWSSAGPPRDGNREDATKDDAVGSSRSRPAACAPSARRSKTPKPAADPRLRVAASRSVLPPMPPVSPPAKIEEETHTMRRERSWLSELRSTASGARGRAAFRAAYERDADIEWVAINDLAEPAMLAQLLRHDTVYGPFAGSVEAVDGAIIVDGVPDRGARPRRSRRACPGRISTSTS